MPIDAPLTPLVVKLKFDELNPVILAPNVILYVTVLALVMATFGVPLTIELIVVPSATLNVKLLLVLIQPVVLFLTLATKL